MGGSIVGATGGATVERLPERTYSITHPFVRMAQGIWLASVLLTPVSLAFMPAAAIDWPLRRLLWLSFFSGRV
jgi:hypothetical protein